MGRFLTLDKGRKAKEEVAFFRCRDVWIDGRMAVVLCGFCGENRSGKKNRYQRGKTAESFHCLNLRLFV